jgi:hypothetical protein
MVLKSLLKRKVLLLHIGWWLGFGLSLSYLPLMMLETRDALFYIGRTLLGSIVIFYVNAYFLMPRYVSKGRYARYTGRAILLVGCMVLMHWALHNKFEGRTIAEARVQQNWEEKIAGNSFLSENRSVIIRKSVSPLDRKGYMAILLMGIPSFIVNLFISTLYWIYTDSRSRKQHELTLVNQNLVNEMKFLKSQMNPHFLFNALNNIYSLSMLNSVKTPEMILKLSAMLRYVLYESEDVKVKLGKEVDYIKNFVEFQRIKIEGIPNIHMDIDRVDRMLKIEPMLLIPFVENSFKHSKIEDTENGWISIMLVSDEKGIYFEVSNSVPNTKMAVDKNSGIGVENVKRRLKHLYPSKHYISIKSDEKAYKLRLKIELV